MPNRSRYFTSLQTVSMNTRPEGIAATTHDILSTKKADGVCNITELAVQFFQKHGNAVTAEILYNTISYRTVGMSGRCLLTMRGEEMHLTAKMTGGQIPDEWRDKMMAAPEDLNAT